MFDDGGNVRAGATCLIDGHENTLCPVMSSEGVKVCEEGFAMHSFNFLWDIATMELLSFPGFVATPTRVLVVLAFKHGIGWSCPSMSMVNR